MRSAESANRPPLSKIVLASRTTWLHRACSSNVALHFSMFDFNVSSRDKSSTPATLRVSNDLSCDAKFCISVSTDRSTSSMRATSDRTRGMIVMLSTIPVSNWSV